MPQESKASRSNPVNLKFPYFQMPSRRHFETLRRAREDFNPK